MTRNYIVDVDGYVVGTGLSRTAAHRLAWRSMRGTACCVDICRSTDVNNPEAAWVKRDGEWRRDGRTPQRCEPSTTARELRWLADMLDRGKVARFTVKWDGVNNPEVVVVLGGDK